MFGLPPKEQGEGNRGKCLYASDSVPKEPLHLIPLQHPVAVHLKAAWHSLSHLPSPEEGKSNISVHPTVLCVAQPGENRTRL